MINEQISECVFFRVKRQQKVEETFNVRTKLLYMDY